MLLVLLSLNINAAYADDPERYTQVRVVPEKTYINSSDEITLAVEIKLAPHWHVYWKNPGDSGLAVKIDWKTPEDFELSEISWPTPKKISYDILSNYGYYEEAILLQTLKVPNDLPAGKVTLTANVAMLVCNEICIPESAEISVDFNDGTVNIDNSDYIKIAKSKIAKTLDGEFSYSEKNNNLILSLTTQNSELLNAATQNNIEFFPLEWGIINYLAKPEIMLENDKITISHERSDRKLSDITDLKGLVVIKIPNNPNKGFAIKAASKPLTTAKNLTPTKDVQKSVQPSLQTDKITWLSAIYLALFGGIILNLMPCVFPVLSIKALSLIKMGEKDNKMARLHGISYTLGVILSFLAIGATLLVLKEAGTAVGWGFQLQNPIIVAILAYLLFIIGLNLIGFFEFGNKLGNIGNKMAQGKSLSGSFFTGTLATVVATPCTAPFMGAAMGFAMTQNALISMSVFASLGFGLALPYLLLSYFPILRKFLPKPGAWMDIFKQFLAFPIFASSIWLVWVLSEQSGSYGVLLILLGMLAIAFCIWLSHLHNKHGKLITRLLLILCLSLPLFSLSYIKSTEDAICSSEKIHPLGEVFSNDKLSRLLEGDRPIFVEMTAAWCITCKVNHALAINTNIIKTTFKDNNVSYLIGDWTNKDDVITEYLDKFGRNGVPLYVFYGARNLTTGERPNAVLLPQVITTSIIKKAVEKHSK